MVRQLTPGCMRVNLPRTWGASIEPAPHLGRVNLPRTHMGQVDAGETVSHNI